MHIEIRYRKIFYRIPVTHTKNNNLSLMVSENILELIR